MAYMTEAKYGKRDERTSGKKVKVTFTSFPEVPSYFVSVIIIEYILIGGRRSETEMNETVKHIYLFNCDKTYNLDVVESLLTESGLEFQINIVKRYFDLNTMAEMCEDIMSEPQMNFAIFVVHANESRLSINEENAGIGYAVIYKTLQRKTGEYIQNALSLCALFKYFFATNN